MTTIENRTVAAQAGPRHIGSLREHRLPFRPRAAFFVPRSGRKGRSNMTRKSTDSTALAIDADMAKAMPHAEGIADDEVVRYIDDDISRDTDTHANGKDRFDYMHDRWLCSMYALTGNRERRLLAWISDNIRWARQIWDASPDDSSDSSEPANLF